jgi:mono/diheme cytochrome c family protein
VGALRALTALLLGVSWEGQPYYPALPYNFYTMMSMKDLADLKAYLDTVPLWSQPSRAHELAFPCDRRWGLHLWQWAFFRPSRLAPEPAKDAAWNRGTYLVEGPGHCQECHTRPFAGGPAPNLGAGKISNISGDPELGLGNWSAGDLTTLLTLGITPKGDFVGSEMAKIIDEGTSKLPPDDLTAMVVYLNPYSPDTAACS